MLERYYGTSGKGLFLLLSSHDWTYCDESLLSSLYHIGSPSVVGTTNLITHEICNLLFQIIEEFFGPFLFCDGIGNLARIDVGVKIK